MDNREEHPRVSVGTVQDWQKLKSKYRASFIEAITQIAAAQGLTRGQDAALAHMEQVRGYMSKRFVWPTITHSRSGLNERSTMHNLIYA
jgi:hypothetical protein